MIVHLVIRDFWLVVPKNFADGIKSPLWRSCSRWGSVFSYLDVDEIIELSIFNNCRRSFYAWGNTMYYRQTSSQLQNFSNRKLIRLQRMLFLSALAERNPYCHHEQCDYRTKSTMVCKTSSWTRASVPLTIVDVINYLALLWSAYACLWLGYLKDWHPCTWSTCW